MREIHEAVLSNDIEKVRKVIQKKIREEKRYTIDVTDGKMSTPLMTACSYNTLKGTGGNIAIVTCLVEAGADVNFVWGGYTAFMYACMNGYQNVATYLLPKVKDIDASTHDGATALSMACHKKNISMIRFLLAAGADPKKILPSFYQNLSQDIRYILDTESKKGKDKPQEAYISSPQPVYSAPAGQQAFFHAPHTRSGSSNAASVMNATANVLDSFAHVADASSDFPGFNNF